MSNVYVVMVLVSPKFPAGHWLGAFSSLALAKGSINETYSALGIPTYTKEHTYIRADCPNRDVLLIAEIEYHTETTHL